jgi:hypothetical protein
MLGSSNNASGTKAACQLFYAKSSMPAPLNPEPLLGMLADPPFDHVHDHLRCRLDIDLPDGVARRWECVGKLNAELSAGKSNRATAQDGAIEPSRKPSENRTGFVRLPEEPDVHPVREVFVDDHADAAAPLENIDDSEGGDRARWNETSSGSCPNPAEFLIDDRDIRGTVDDGGLPWVRPECPNGQLPIGEMGPKNEAGPFRID